MLTPRAVMTLLLAGTVAVVGAGCSQDSSAAPPAQPETVSIGVRVVPVRRGDIVSVIEAVGTLQPVQEATLSCRVPGRIAVLALDVGDEVAADQVLVELDQGEFRLAVQQAEAAVGSANARLDGAKLVHRRVNELQAQNIASTERKDAAATELAIAQAQLREARAALAIAEDQQAHSIMTAPFAGSVAAVYAHVGERVGPGQPLLRLVNLDSVEVDVTISEKRIADVAVEQPVDVRVDGFPGQTFSGVVRRIAPTVDPASRTFVTTIQLPNQEHRLHPGMFARAEISVNAHRDTLLVHRTGLLERGGQLWAVRVRDGRAERVEVSAGYRYRDTVEVRAGLEEGDRVVTEGAYGLANDAPLHILTDE